VRRRKARRPATADAVREPHGFSAGELRDRDAIPKSPACLSAAPAVYDGAATARVLRDMVRRVIEQHISAAETEALRAAEDSERELLRAWGGR
jgi:hypothetical protein